MDDKLIAFFWAHVNKTPTCWNWTAGSDAHGLPRMWLGKRHNPRHISMQIHGKAIFSEVLSICKDKLCVNPEHLVSGDVARFWSKVQKLSQANGGCWIWTAGENSDGYGAFKAMQKMHHAHLYSWQLTHGPIKSDLACVCHTCDNRRCVNPNHLFLGDNNDNVQDMVSKGRHAHGITNGMAKFSVDQVKEIRQLYATGNYTLRQLASRFDVDPMTVSAIVHRRTWKHVL